jgi:hypothetical protein
MKGGKVQGRKAKLSATENKQSRINGLDQRAHSHCRKANYANSCGTVTKAKLDLRLLLCVQGPTRARPTAKLEGQRTAGCKTSGGGAAAAGRTKIPLCCCRIHETPGGQGGTPKGPEGTAGGRE